MPFLYELKLDASEREYTFLQQLVPAGTLVGTGQAVAVLSDGAMEFHLPAPKQGLLVEWRVESGATVRTSDAIARIVCEGTEVDVPGAVPERLG
ncbi:biotin/lipoyl-containing protein [Granulicella arctica]|uniref:Pyruvate/2-oxoglutarate dehydrogenase complex dihydrolipoamide acyltransferase (E2) component n=1 Tax=Granulicella arctica TaxID=940613 RepID=A0A7Y9TFW8_9BACT|nr:biotin/lipoyl-containing protein [Granulicella arctica]NYF79241.1 pyruvate/2-oxoglutarate dehydrogenase complex dihydrolipoamide acyltransferase (E2) component [Granulicella arctica]